MRVSAPAAGYAVLGVVAGAVVGFVSLEAVYGIVLLGVTATLLVRRAGRRRWFVLGGFLLGVGACGAGFLGRALTNHDPAVTYDPSMVPVFWLACVIAICGVVTLAAATAVEAARSRRPLPGG